VAACDEAGHAKDLAYRYLAIRPRSRAELLAYLKKKGVTEETSAGVASTLEGYGFIDDGAFALTYSKYLLEKKGLSRYALRMELKRKGVSDTHIDAAIEALSGEEGQDEEEVALKAARRKASSLKGVDRERARRRLVDFLRRRGYSFDIINKVTRRIG
jgi:regulatory protein